MKNDYVVYKLVFSNGMVYIGKTCNLKRRLTEHKHRALSYFGIKGDKEDNVSFIYEVLYKAPKYYSDENRQVCIDNAERNFIHLECRNIIKEETGSDKIYNNYQSFQKLINRRMYNKVLY